MHESGLRRVQLAKAEYLLDPASIKELSQAQVNEIEDNYYQKNGFIADLKMDSYLRPVTCPSRFRTTDSDRLIAPFRRRFVRTPFAVAATTTRHQELW